MLLWKLRLQFVSNVICTFTEAEALIMSASLYVFPHTQMGAVGGDFQQWGSERTRCDMNTTPSLPLGCVSDWNSLLLWECGETQTLPYSEELVPSASQQPDKWEPAVLSQAKAAHLFEYPSPLNSNKGNSWSSIGVRERPARRDS